MSLEFLGYSYVGPDVQVEEENFQVDFEVAIVVLHCCFIA